MADGIDPQLRVERTGTKQYIGRNSRGAEVRLGTADSELAEFTPGELLQIALAACGGFTTDFLLSRRLGEDFEQTIEVTADKHESEDRYASLHENFHLDLSNYDEAGRAKLQALLHRATAQHCTVELTLTNGAEVDMILTDSSTVTAPSS